MTWMRKWLKEISGPTFCFKSASVFLLNCWTLNPTSSPKPTGSCHEWGCFVRNAEHCNARHKYHGILLWSFHQSTVGSQSCMCLLSCDFLLHGFFSFLPHLCPPKNGKKGNFSYNLGSAKIAMKFPYPLPNAKHVKPGTTDSSLWFAVGCVRKLLSALSESFSVMGFQRSRDCRGDVFNSCQFEAFISRSTLPASVCTWKGC